MNDAIAPAAARVRAHGKGGKDAEAIHDMRVAIRRLRVALKLARPIYSRFYADAAREGLTVLHRATSALRDEEVLEETLANVDVPGPAFKGWRARRKSRERALRRAVLERLRTGELEHARALVTALVTLPVRPKRDRDLSKLARRAMEDACARVESMRGVSVHDVAGMHALRIAYKQLRYTAEIFAPALPPHLAALGKPAAQFQKRLGEIHDLDVALEAIHRARGLPVATQARVLAALRSQRVEAVARYLARTLEEAQHGGVRGDVTPGINP